MMKNRLAERGDEKDKERARELKGCVRAELRACDTSYLGNGPSLSWGVALSAALVAPTPTPTPPRQTHTHTESVPSAIVTLMTIPSFIVTHFKRSVHWDHHLCNTLERICPLRPLQWVNI